MAERRLRRHLAADRRRRLRRPHRRELVDGRRCVPGPRTLCLLDGRVRVEVAWRAFDGSSGLGRAVPATDESGFFWFFEPGNLELVVKVLDARVLNDHWWVFYGALSNVAYRLRVEDTLIGELRSYENPLHHFASRGDTAAFPID